MHIGNTNSYNGNPQINYLLPPLAAAIEDAFVRLAGDGDISLFVILVVAGSRLEGAAAATAKKVAMTNYEKKSKLFNKR
ncbi:hypothetical protein OUZ56_006059 [Daphnia magna]|uniref:Uncharacterized protein n=1 Tax=Daphnia magna TaxID=35525 RepID=A0ABQ9YUQ6_9CRUS|nr:hypothetical protein OUZ56_006044 [Daphnia magna]KAK4004312.1 hypothetical protein OUZ56_006051 [Daphnia magna]KAK4004316.1 hypothetical protein OUZ56_006055 [Daphnia magna]KAK4004320.1 hypothetical protein OUZ56_006059 [Daphnia magna]